MTTTDPHVGTGAGSARAMQATESALFPSFSGSRFSGGYFAAQGLAVAAWWLLLWLRPEMRPLFLPEGAGETELLAFALPDLGLAALGSLAAAGAFAARSRLVIPLAWLTTGTVAYAAAYCVAWAALRQDGWLNVALMVPAAMLSVIAALDATCADLPLFRRARPGARRRHTLSTLAQVALFWSTFLWVLPASIGFVEARLAWPGFAFPEQRPAAAVVFLLCSALGLASGLTMATRGDGTPLPMAAPNRLVLTGPYAYLRNPMVVAGLGQGAAVGIWLGSWSVLAYVLLGGVLWQLLVRPAEERDLARSFPDTYPAYQAGVRCWLPRLRPFGRQPGTRAPAANRPITRR